MQCLTSQQSTIFAITDVGFVAPHHLDKPMPPGEMLTLKLLTNSGGTHKFAHTSV
jgi:hypothetical protein